MKSRNCQGPKPGAGDQRGGGKAGGSKHDAEIVQRGRAEINARPTFPAPESGFIRGNTKQRCFLGCHARTIHCSTWNKRRAPRHGAGTTTEFTRSDHGHSDLAGTATEFTRRPRRTTANTAGRGEGSEVGVRSSERQPWGQAADVKTRVGGSLSPPPACSTERRTQVYDASEPQTPSSEPRPPDPSSSRRGRRGSPWSQCELSRRARRVRVLRFRTGWGMFNACLGFRNRTTSSSSVPAMPGWKRRQRRPGSNAGR